MFCFSPFIFCFYIEVELTHNIPFLVHHLVIQQFRQKKTNVTWFYLYVESNSFFTHIYVVHIQLNILRGAFGDLSPLVWYPKNSSHLGFPKLHPLNSRRRPNIFWFLCVAVWPKNSLQEATHDNHRAYFICALSSRDHRPSLPDVWCLQYHCFIYFIWFISCSRWEQQI